MATKKDIESQITKLKANYKKVKKALKDAGYDVENPKQLESVFQKMPIGEILEGINGTVYEFVTSYQNELDSLYDQIKNFKSQRKTSKDNVEKLLATGSNFKKVLEQINKEIVNDLPKDQKAYEQLFIVLEEERKLFNEEYGQYSSYGYNILKQINNIRETAKASKGSIKELKPLTKNINVLKNVLSDHFEATEERASLLRQLDESEMTLKKEIDRNKGIFSRGRRFLGRHGVTATSLIAGMTTNNPLAMWLTSIAGDFFVQGKQRKAEQKMYKTQQLKELRENLYYQETGRGKRQISDWFVDKQSTMRSQQSRQLQSSDLIYQELLLHTKYLKQLAEGGHEQYDFMQEQERVRQREFDIQQSAQEEVVMEQGQTPGVYQLQSKKQAEGADKEHDAMFSGLKGLLKKYMKLFLGSFLLAPLVWQFIKIFGSVIKRAFVGLAGIIRTAAMVAGRFLMSSLGIALSSALIGAVFSAINMKEASEKFEKWGVEKVSAILSTQTLPLIGLLVGALFGPLGMLIGYAIGAVANYLLPENWKMEIANVVQDTKDFMEQFWYKAQISLSWLADSFGDMWLGIQRLFWRLRVAIINFKKSINNVAQDISGGVMREIFSREKLDKELAQVTQDYYVKPTKERRIRRAERGKKVADLDDKIQQVADTNIAREEKARKLANTRELIQPSAGAEGATAMGGEIKQAQVSEAGLDFIKAQEGFRNKPYWDVNGWAIGYGSHTMPDGRPVTPGDTITEQDASEMLRKDVNSKYLNPIRENIQQNLTQEQIDALASISYNAGAGIWQQGDLTKMINAGDVSGAGERIKTYRATAGGTPHAGLRARRAAESAMFAGAPASKTYLAANQANEGAKLAAAMTPKALPIIIPTGGQTQERLPSGSREASRGAPRGNEPALQMALNSDFSGSSS